MSVHSPAPPGPPVVPVAELRRQHTAWHRQPQGARRMPPTPAPRVARAVQFSDLFSVPPEYCTRSPHCPHGQLFMSMSGGPGRAPVIASALAVLDPDVFDPWPALQCVAAVEDGGTMQQRLPFSFHMHVHPRSLQGAINAAIRLRYLGSASRIASCSSPSRFPTC